MSGKYNSNNDFIVKRILRKNEKSDIIFYVEDDGTITNEIYCVVVKRGLSKENTLKEAEKILKIAGFNNKIITSIKKDRLDYDENEGCWDLNIGNEYKSELVWILQTN